MARTSMRVWLVVGLSTVGFFAMPWWAEPAAAQRTSKRTAAPADDDPFSAPSDTARATAAPADDEPFGAPRQPAAAPAPAAAKKGPSDLELEAKIRQALTQPTVMEFIETPLEQAVDYLKDLHGIEIQLDKRALEEAGIGTDVPITRTLNGVSLGSAMRLLLGSNDLTHVVRDGVMLVTTQDAAQNMVDLRVYDVHDLIGEDADVRDVMAIMHLVLDGELASPGAHSSRMPSRADEPKSTTCAGTNQILPFGDLLVVRASINQQEAVRDLLDELRQKLRQAKQ